MSFVIACRRPLRLWETIAASAAVHALAVTAGWWGWQRANATYAGTQIGVEVEIAAGQFLTPSVAKKTQKALPPVKGHRDLDFPDRSAGKPAAAQPDSSQSSKGSGGFASQTRGGSGSAWDVYRNSLRNRIHEALHYPRVSKNLGETGQVSVRFSVRRDGTIEDVQLEVPSAFDRLNEAALDTVKRVARLDPLPADFDSDRWNTFVPIEFALK